MESSEIKKEKKSYATPAERIADGFKEKYINTGKFDITLLGDDKELEKALELAKNRIGFTGGDIKEIFAEIRKACSENLAKIAEEKSKQVQIEKEKEEEQIKIAEQQKEQIRLENKRKIEEEKAALRAELAETYKENIRRDLETKFKKDNPVVEVKPEVKLETKAEVVPEWKRLLEKKPKKVKVIEPEPIPEHIGVQLREVNISTVNDEELKRIARINIDSEEKIKQRKFILENKDVVGDLCNRAELILTKDLDAEEYIKAGIFSREEVEMHNQDVNEMQELYDQKNTPEEKEIKKVATIFEAMTIESINLSKCFGDEAFASPVFPVDDIFAPKVDGSVRLKGTILGLDMSMRNIKGEAFTEKVERNLRIIRKGNPDRLKYGKNADGTLTTDVFIPKIIISAELSLVKSVMYDFHTLSKEEFGEKLKDHKLSREIVLQTIAQCRIYGKFARDNGQDKTAEHYKKFVDNLYEIAEESPVLKKNIGNAGFDSVSERIQEIVDEFNFKEIKKQEALEEFRASKKTA